MAWPGADAVVGQRMNDPRKSVPAPRPRHAAPLGTGGAASPTPIYDALVHQWRALQREVPRPPTARQGWVRVDPQDLFHRG
ncbi:hypothetical protein ACWFRM_33990 [Streptomyces sp. NPDC055144]